MVDPNTIAPLTADALFAEFAFFASLLIVGWAVAGVLALVGPVVRARLARVVFR